MPPIAVVQSSGGKCTDYLDLSVLFRGENCKSRCISERIKRYIFNVGCIAGVNL